VRGSTGDTPLHRAAFTNRLQLVELLLQQPGIDFASENNEAHTALALARNPDVVALLKCAQPRSAASSCWQLPR